MKEKLIHLRYQYDNHFGAAMCGRDDWQYEEHETWAIDEEDTNCEDCLNSTTLKLLNERPGQIEKDRLAREKFKNSDAYKLMRKAIRECVTVTPIEHTDE